MDSYRIIVTPDAEADLSELRDYIANVLRSPETARSYLLHLRKEIGSLSEMPARIKADDEEPWHLRGIRKLIVKNFLVYFRKRQINRDEEKENRAGWSQEKHPAR